MTTYTNSCDMQNADFTTTGNWNFDGTNFDVAASAIGQIDAVALNLGISLATSLHMGNISCVFTGSFASASLTTDTGDLVLSATLGKAFLFSQGKCNIGSSGDTIEIGAFGDLKAVGDGVQIDVNTGSVAAILVGSVEAKAMTLGNAACVMTMNFNGLNALGNSNVVIGTNSGSFDAGTMAGQTNIHGSGVKLEADTSDIEIYTSGANSININGLQVASAITINIATLLTTALNIGAAACTTTVDATSILLPNLPVAVAGTRPVMADPITGRLYLAP